MTDNLTKEQRFRNMSNIKSKDTIPELKVRSYLFRKGLRYRLHDSKLPGRPDMVLKKYKVVLFVNGCFWHRHKGCKFYSIPKTNSEYWNKKLKRNEERDKVTHRKLIQEGWKVIVIWECELMGNTYDKYLNKIIFKILNGS